MLEICKEFFGELNSEGVRYCHWKSNSHLDIALDGKTDLDVLVHPDDRSAFESSMSTADFKCMLSQPDKRFPGFEDYLGFDRETGEFIHLHVHYCLIMGRKYIKNHLLPIEQLYFENLTQKYGVNVPRPELELLVLIMRAHLKTDYVALLKHAIKDVMGANYTAFPADIENEFRELLAEADMDEFARLLQASGLPVELDWCLAFVRRFTGGKLRAHHIWAGHYRVRRWLRPYRRDTGVSVPLAYLKHFLLDTKIAAMLLGRLKKTLPGSGRVFSIIGADGSGKSTLIEDLTKWMSWKLSTRQYYYGIPKDRVRDITGFMMRVFRVLRLPSLGRLTEDLLWIHVARARRDVSRQTERDVARGYVVVSDRFPLPDFQGMAEPMDNPRIDSSVTLFGVNLRKVEEKCYADLRFPDLAIVLQVDIEELRRRKTDLDRDTHVLKADAVNSIESREGLVTVDANRPYQTVLLDVKRAIWKAI